MKQVIVLCALALLGAFGLWHAQSKKSDCFSPSNVKPSAALDLPSIESEMSPEVQQILRQEFTFLGSGNQCYAFASRDGKYVLKLIKFHCMEGEKLKAKLARVLQGFAIAYTYDKEACGLIYMQFKPQVVDIPLHLVDKAYRKHTLPSSELIFALQKRATPTGELLKSLANQGDREQVNSKIESLYHFLEEDLKKGVYDQDHNVMHNTGFAGDLPLRIDFGKLTLHPGMKDAVTREQELKKIAEERIDPWLNRELL